MNKLKETRERAALKQSELAILLKTTQATISNWENDKSEIDNESLKRLCQIFNVSSDYLLGLNENMNKSVKQKLPALNEQEQELIKYFKLLNDAGRGYVVDRVREMTDWEHVGKSEVARRIFLDALNSEQSRRDDRVK